MSDNETSAQRLLRLLSQIDFRPEVAERVPAAVELINAYRRSWIDNGGLLEDDPLNKALGTVCAAAGWWANGLSVSAASDV